MFLTAYVEEEFRVARQLATKLPQIGSKLIRIAVPRILQLTRRHMVVVVPCPFIEKTTQFNRRVCRSLRSLRPGNPLLKIFNIVPNDDSADIAHMRAMLIATERDVLHAWSV
ncbi:hypothetical protein W02_08350 [Nitrospira sp. KM1]|nr:hypothetical protein W02_08350 [Nitrospira sp. KM1]